MICPHCKTDLLYRARPNKTCSRCRQRFALEPKLSMLRTHDLRVQRADAALSAHGTLWYTEGQLLWRLMRQRLQRIHNPIKWMLRQPRERVRVPAGVTPPRFRTSP